MKLVPLVVLLLAGSNCVTLHAQEKKFTDPLGVLGEGESPTPPPDHLDPGDGWEVIMKGEQHRRPADLQRVAITRAEIRFSSEDNLNKFLEILRETDERLRSVDGPEYDWQFVSKKGNTVRFGVAWYNADFFARRRNAYKSATHKAIFESLGIKPEDLRIEHIPLQFNHRHTTNPKR